MNNLEIKNEMEKKEYFESLLVIISSVSKQNIDLNLIKGIRKQVKFNEDVQMWKPTKETDLEDKHHKHYDPNAVIELFVKDFYYRKYKLADMPLHGKQVPGDGGDIWFPIHNVEELSKFVKYVSDKGYTFNRTKQ